MSRVAWRSWFASRMAGAFLVVGTVAALWGHPETVSDSARDPGGGSAPAARDPTTREYCGVREVSRLPLILKDGREVYLRATTFSASQGDVLLLGTPNYIFERSPAGEIIGGEHNSVMGAFLGRDGPLRLVPAPVPATRVAGVRSHGRSDGGWNVVFAEMAEPYDSDTERDNTVAHLWYGVFDGSEWTELEQIPLPHRSIITESQVNSSSALVHQDGELAWSLRADQADSWFNTVVVFERKGGNWSAEVLTGVRAAYSALTYSDSLGLIMVASHPDPRGWDNPDALRDTLAGSAGAFDSNSLFLYVRDPTWRIMRKVLSGTDAPVHNPILTRKLSDGVMVWSSPPPGQIGVSFAQDLWAMPGDQLLRPGGEVIPIGSGAVRHMLVEAPDGRAIIVFEVPHSATEGEVGFAQISSSGSVRRLGTLSNPFGLYSMFPVAPEADEILLAGAALTQTEGVLTGAVTLFIRLRIECESDGP